MSKIMYANYAGIKNEQHIPDAVAQSDLKNGYVVVKGVDEKGIDVATGKVLVEVDPKYFRPAEVEQLLGDPTKARTLLGWNPRKTSFGELVSIMVRHDMEKVRRMIATKH